MSDRPDLIELDEGDVRVFARFAERLINVYARIGELRHQTTLEEQRLLAEAAQIASERQSVASALSLAYELDDPNEWTLDLDALSFRRL